MKNEKWFYPAQEKIKNYLAEKFVDARNLQFREISHDLVIECYHGILKDKVIQQSADETTVLFVIHKGKVISRNLPLIEVFYGVYTDTMQYHPQEETSTV